MATKTAFSTLAVAVASPAGTVVFAYPAGTNQAFFTSGNASGNGVAIIEDNDFYLEVDDKVDITYGASDITVTNKSGVTWPAGASLRMGFAYASPSNVTVVAQPAEANLAGSLTGTTDGTMEDLPASITGTLTGTTDGAMVDIAAAAAATAGGATPSATNVDTGIATAVAPIVTGTNLQLKELQVKLNAVIVSQNLQNKELKTKIDSLLAKLRAAGVLTT